MPGMIELSILAVLLLGGLVGTVVYLLRLWRRSIELREKQLEHDRSQHEARASRLRD
jgi:hypothetical protein